MTTTAPTATPSITETSAPAATTTRTLGIISLALGVASIISGFNPVMGLAALVLGVLALRTESDSRGISIAGIVTGSVSLVGVVVGIWAVVLAIPFFGAFASPLFW